jgi:hypothetical protein
MKNLLKILAFFISLSSIAQTKYASLNDACTKNANGSGVNNNSVTVYIANFTNNDYAFVSNDNNNYKRLKRGYYFHKAQNSAFQVNIRGRITEIQTCASAVAGQYPNSPSDANYGIVGWVNYGTDYDNIKNEISGGSTRFDFYGNSNGQSYPTGLKNGNGYETMSFSTHSITQKNELTNLVSMCRYKITDSQGKVVMFVEDTRGGFHPCHNNPNCNSVLRGNNHPDDSNRYLAEGNYTIEYSNITNHSTNMPQRLQLWYQDQNTLEYKINEVVNNGETVTRNFSITNTNSTPNAYFKLNSNVF